MQRHVPAAAPPPGPPPLGALLRRPAALLRGEGELSALLHRYLDKSISTEATSEDINMKSV